MTAAYLGLLPEEGGIPLSHYWAYERAHGQTAEPFDYACFKEPAIMDGNLAPRWLDGRSANYEYLRRLHPAPAAAR